jgi:adenine-specific DNA methylase
MSLEEHFDPVFTTALALREKQIQQEYRPIIGVHKWFARRPGTVFRSLLLAEFNGVESLQTGYWIGHHLHGVIADPFMGGGTTVFEANRLGFSVVGTDTNSMAYWIVRQSLVPLDGEAFAATAREVTSDIECHLGNFYSTSCIKCGETAPVKYFLWVKVAPCPACGRENDLFPGHLLAEAVRHPKHVLVCERCGSLNEYDHQPTRADPERCPECQSPVHLEGPTSRQRTVCRDCGHTYPYLAKNQANPLGHRLWALEYYCEPCKATHTGRFFKRPDAEDLARCERARMLLAGTSDLPIPDDKIPSGDETDRLHRWGYQCYREMFNERQLLGLGLLLRRIGQVNDAETRYALLTVFSDCLRYQNMLCRYDTYALKCQDIFSVHGFPVGLVRCENNLLGIPRVGSGGFRHFIEKYVRAKQYCQAPFETRSDGHRKKRVLIPGEQIQAQLVDTFPDSHKREAYLRACSGTDVLLPPASLDGVFTDPPYFDNVQYAELMDFCYVWLRLALHKEFPEFRRASTRSDDELTGNVTLKRGLEHFTAGLSGIFHYYASALKPGAPFVFTYHHNNPAAYIPVVVAILDAGLHCTATLPAAAEMSASLHIAGTNSSILDSVFVCRAGAAHPQNPNIEETLIRDAEAMKAAGVRVTLGDLKCLAAGHMARLAIDSLAPNWDAEVPLSQRMDRVRKHLANLAEQLAFDGLAARILKVATHDSRQGAAPTETL